MNCDQFEQMLPDALGSELGDADREAFDAHRAGCPACAREYDGLATTVRSVRRTAEVPPVSARRIGSRLVLEQGAHGAAAVAAGHSTPWRAAFRYAAAILMAFVAGYAASDRLRGGSPAAPRIADVTPSQAPAESGASAGSGATFESALAAVHQQDPTAPGLAKCVRALLGSAR